MRNMMEYPKYLIIKDWIKKYYIIFILVIVSIAAGITGIVRSNHISKDNDSLNKVIVFLENGLSNSNKYNNISMCKLSNGKSILEFKTDKNNDTFHIAIVFYEPNEKGRKKYLFVSDELISVDDPYSKKEIIKMLKKLDILK